MNTRDIINKESPIMEISTCRFQKFGKNIRELHLLGQI